MKPVTFSCSGSAPEARTRLEAVIDGRPWNAVGLDGVATSLMTTLDPSLT